MCNQLGHSRQIVLYLVFFFVSLFVALFSLNRLRAAALVSLLILLSGCTLQIWAGYSDPDLSGHAWGSDDAYITYRYARTFNEGSGIVFNTNERVEGYSSLLHVLLVSLGLRIVTSENIYLLMSLLNLIFVTLSAVVFYRHVKSTLGEISANAALFLLSLCPPLWVIRKGVVTKCIRLEWSVK